MDRVNAEVGCTEDALPGCHVTRGKPCDCAFIVDTLIEDVEAALAEEADDA